MKASGRWAWWNQYIPNNMTTDSLIDRAKEAKLDGVIVKAGYWGIMDQFQRAGIRVGVDVYAKPGSNLMAADMLVQGIRNGAKFAIVNAEHEWERPDSGEQMRQLCSRFRNQVTLEQAELYASVDTRGRRMLMPYQQVLSRYITGWMPMIYPKAFEQSVVVAFSACLDNKDFAGKPILPTIQAYDNIGAVAVGSQIFQAIFQRGLPGYSVYTIGHATDDEWQAVINDIPEEEEDMPDWLDTTIVDLGGQPLLFNVLQADMSFRAEQMTWRRYLTLTVLGYLESTHSHMATVKLNMG